MNQVLTMINKQICNWSTPASLGQGPGFDAGDKKLGEDKTSDLSSSLSFAVSWYLIFSQFSPGSKYSYKILNFSTSKPVAALNNFSSVMNCHKKITCFLSYQHKHYYILILLRVYFFLLPVL